MNNQTTCRYCNKTTLTKNKMKFCNRECYRNFQKEDTSTIKKLIKSRPNMSGEKNPAWKGDHVNYGALHDWVALRKGRPSYCVQCKSKKEKKYEWANISGDYKRDLNDWIRLCVKCHRKYDNCHINMGKKVKQILNGKVVSIFDSITEASKKTGFPYFSIRRCGMLNKEYMGYKFEIAKKRTCMEVDK